jgi:hypothetical protein
MKRLLILLPLVVLWLAFFTAHYFQLFEYNPETHTVTNEWAMVPTVMTMLVAFAISVIFAIEKNTR